MLPSNVAALLVFVVAVLPGASYTWAFEREVGSFGVTLADRTLRFVAVSVAFHLTLGWPEYWFYRVALNKHGFDGAQFAAAWGAVVLLSVLPALAGSYLGRLYAARRLDKPSWLQRQANAGKVTKRALDYMVGHERAPRAWDDIFSERPTTYVRVRTTDGSWMAGLFASRSYAAGYPNQPDLFLEQAWSLKDDATLSKWRGCGKCSATTRDSDRIVAAAPGPARDRPTPDNAAQRWPGQRADSGEIVAFVSRSSRKLARKVRYFHPADPRGTTHSTR